MTQYKNIILDLDDTLLPCGRFYVECNKRFAAYQNARTGLSEEFCREVLSSIDLACTKLPVGFSKERYPNSFAAASYALDSIAQLEPSPKAAHYSFQIGHAVFDAPYDLFEGAHDLLVKYRSLGYRIFLFTKGDREIQKSKIIRNRLHDVFPEDHMHVVDRKTPESLGFLVDYHRLNVDESIMIGDSIRDDIGTATALGMDSVWVGHGGTDKWGYENESHKPTYVIDGILELPTIISL